MRLLAAILLCGALWGQAPRKSSGVKTPGVQIPFANLKPELEYPVQGDWVAVADAVWAPDPKRGGLVRIDPKAKDAKLGDPLTGLDGPCGGVISAFNHIWAAACGDRSLVRIDAKSLKIVSRAAFGTSAAYPSIAATADSVWMLMDDKTTLARIDPEQVSVVAEMRLPAGCGSVVSGEGALWVACPTSERILRIDPRTNVVEKTIRIEGEPERLTIGDGSLWVWRRKPGILDRIDPKSNQSVKSIDLGAPGSSAMLAFGEGNVWLSMSGFPITRVDPQTDKVAQQFYGEGGGAIAAGQGWIWLVNRNTGVLWKIDPRRILATLAE